MQKKTKERIDRKFQNLELHQIDASIFIELFLENRKNYEKCSDYINTLGYKYRGSISIPALGEICYTIITKIKDSKKKEDAFRLLYEKIERHEIDFYSPKKEDYDLAKEMIISDTILESADALRLAETKGNKAKKFITLDGDLVKNKVLQKNYNIKIELPS